MTDLGAALGRIRLVTAELLAQEDEDSLALAVIALELQESLEDLGVEPEHFEPAAGGVAALNEAARLLGQSAEELPLGAWVRFQELLGVVGA